MCVCVCVCVSDLQGQHQPRESPGSLRETQRQPRSPALPAEHSGCESFPTTTFFAEFLSLVLFPSSDGLLFLLFSVFQLTLWINEKMLTAQDTSYDEARNLHSKWQKHQAFMAELASNKDWLDKMDKVKAMVGSV